MSSEPIGVGHMDIEPDRETASAAVQALQSEVELADGNLDALDRKAALLPAFLAALAGLFIGPETTASGLGLGLTLFALGLGIAGVACSLLALRARPLVVGPAADQLLAGLGLPIQYFNQALAGSLAITVNQLTEVAFYKSRWLNRAFVLAMGTILMLSLSRIAGGPHDEQTTITPTPASSEPLEAT